MITIKRGRKRAKLRDGDVLVLYDVVVEAQKRELSYLEDCSIRGISGTLQVLIQDRNITYERILEQLSELLPDRPNTTEHGPKGETS